MVETPLVLSGPQPWTEMLIEYVIDDEIRKEKKKRVQSTTKVSTFGINSSKPTQRGHLPPPTPQVIWQFKFLLELRTYISLIRLEVKC